MNPPARPNKSVSLREATRINLACRPALPPSRLADYAIVAAAIAAIETPDGGTLANGIKQLFDATPDAQWRDHIESVASELAAEEER